MASNSVGNLLLKNCFKMNTVLYLIVHMCLCMGMCTRVQMPEEAKQGGGSLESEVTGHYRPRHQMQRVNMGSSARASACKS